MFAATVAADPTRPQLTFYDDATGERTELSGATLANWVAKTANLIVDETGLGVGGRASIGAPVHWQSAAIRLACWSVGLSVADGPVPADIAFVHVGLATHDWPAADRYALSLHPFALPLRETPSGYADFNSEVRVHGDRFYPAEQPQPADAALVTADAARSHAEVLAEATARAQHFGLDGGRVLIDTDAYPDVVDWLLAPLVAGASLVLCSNLDREREPARSASERVTHRLL